MTSLPQHDDAQRALELELLGEGYAWDHSSFAPFPSLAFPELDQTGVLHGASILIGGYHILPPPERPDRNFLIGQLIGSMPPTLQMLALIPSEEWVAAGLALRDGIRDETAGLAAHVAERLLSAIHESATGELALPSLAEGRELVFLELLDCVRTIGTDVNQRVTRMAAASSLMATSKTLVKEWLSAPVKVRALPWLAAAHEFTGQLLLTDDQMPAPAHREAIARGLDVDLAVLAELFDVFTRFAARMSRNDRLTPALAQSLDGFGRYMPASDLRAVHHDDAAFGCLPVAGGNPLVIERVRERGLPDQFPVDDATFRRALRGLGSSSGLDEGMDLQSAIASRRLYLCDYDLLADLPCRSGPDLDFFSQDMAPSTAGQRYLPAPFGLFYRVEDRLLPLAIQLGRSPRDYEIFTPADAPELWFKVKMAYLCADANHQQMASHIGGCHLLLAGYCIATARTLHPRHPLHRLLRRHLDNVLWTDFIGRQILVNPRGWIEGIYAGTLEYGSLEISRRYYERHHFDDLDFPRSLAARGVDDVDTLPLYPLRDDGLALWTALREFIGSYLELYYRTPADLHDDHELQNWLRALRSPNGAHVPGFPLAVNSAAELAEIVTRIVFRSSCIHSATNYAQYDFYGSPNETPGALRADPRQIREHAYDDFLPGPQPALMQMSLMWLTHAHRDLTLTDYDLSWFDDPRVWPLVARLRTEFARIEATIERANQTRPWSYHYLLPSKVTMAANV